jgi:hypothetical protein
MRTVFRHYRTYSNKRYKPHYGDAIVAHYRPGKGKNGKRLTSWEPMPKGGMTVCLILDDEGRPVNTGIALCSPKDNFCYQIGRDKARDRAEESEAIAWPSWAEDFVAVDGHGYTILTGLSDAGISALMLRCRPEKRLSAVGG